MKKLLSLIFTVATAVTLLTSTAYAADTVSIQDQMALKAVVLDNRDQFNATIMGNALLFANVPTHIPFATIDVELIKYNGSEPALTYTYTKDGSNSFIVSLGDLEKGNYTFSVRYKDDTGYCLSEVSTIVDIAVSNGSAKFVVPNALSLRYYKEHLQYMLDERKDAYALDSYLNTTSKEYYASQAKSLTAGMTDDYAKIKAIQTYVYNDINARGLDCEGASLATQYMLRSIGIPTKTVMGSVLGGDSHSWNRVWVDGRWTTLDSAWGFDGTWFDMPVGQVALNRSTSPAKVVDDKAWDGSVMFIMCKNNTYTTLKVVPNMPLNGVLPSTYGYNPNDLYTDQYYNKKFDVANTGINSNTFKIYVSPTASTGNSTLCTVTYNTYGGSYVAPVTVKAGSKLVKPKPPTRKGLKFVNWYKDAKLTKTWNFATDKVTTNTTIYAGWSK